MDLIMKCNELKRKLQYDHDKLLPFLSFVLSVYIVLFKEKYFLIYFIGEKKIIAAIFFDDFIVKFSCIKK